MEHLEHRAWPVPRQPWVWRQTWCDLSFLHWPVPARDLQPLVPPELTVQEFEGTSWVGLVPFRMQKVLPRGVPALFEGYGFPQLNVRLYVEAEGKPGVWFLSIESASPLAAWGARRFFHLPYHTARMSLQESAGTLSYRSFRASPPGELGFEARVQTHPDTRQAAPGSLEDWLTERYCLYARSPRGRLLRAEIQHLPWQIQRATVEVTRNDLLGLHRLPVSGNPELVHFSRRLEVVVWNPEPLNKAKP